MELSADGLSPPLDSLNTHIILKSCYYEFPPNAGRYLGCLDPVVQTRRMKQKRYDDHTTGV